MKWRRCELPQPQNNQSRGVVKLAFEISNESLRLPAVELES